MPQPSITKICLKITCLKSHSNFLGANELNILVHVGSGNGLVLSAVAWANDADLLTIEPLETDFSEIWIKICEIFFQKNSFKCRLKMAVILMRIQYVPLGQSYDFSEIWIKIHEIFFQENSF